MTKRTVSSAQDEPFDVAVCLSEVLKVDTSVGEIARG